MKYLADVPGVSTSVHDWKPVTPKDFLDALHRYATVCSADAPGEHGNEGMAGVSPWAFKLDRKTTATVWYMPKRGKAPDVIESPVLLTIAREDGSVICFESLNHGLDRAGKPWHASDRIVTHVAPGQAAAPLETGEVDAPRRAVRPSASQAATPHRMDVERVCVLARRAVDATPASGGYTVEVRQKDLDRIARLLSGLPVERYPSEVFDDLEATYALLKRMDAPAANLLEGTYARGTGGAHVEGIAAAFRFYAERVAEYGHQTPDQVQAFDALKAQLQDMHTAQADPGDLTARY